MHGCGSSSAFSSWMAFRERSSMSEIFRVPDSTSRLHCCSAFIRSRLPSMCPTLLRLLHLTSGEGHRFQPTNSRRHPARSESTLNPGRPNAAEPRIRPGARERNWSTSFAPPPTIPRTTLCFFISSSVRRTFSSTEPTGAALVTGLGPWRCSASKPSAVAIGTNHC